VRINADGSAPRDNPFVNRDGVWRNLVVRPSQRPAAVLHPETSQLWTVEHGARGGDELNRPEAGKITAGRSSPTAPTTLI